MSEGIINKALDLIGKTLGSEEEKALHLENCPKGHFGRYGDSCPRCIQLKAKLTEAIPQEATQENPVLSKVEVKNETPVRALTDELEEAIKKAELNPPDKKILSPTTPWTQEGNMWKRDHVRLNQKRPGYRARFVAVRNIERNLADGWLFANIKDYGGLTDRIAGEEKQIDTKIRRRELVLMEIPEDMAKSRDKYFADKATRAEEGIKKVYEADAKKLGVPTYVPR